MNIAELSQDPLFELERRIARRADQLSRESGSEHEHALEHWLQAEREVWESYAPAESQTRASGCIFA